MSAKVLLLDRNPRRTENSPAASSTIRARCGDIKADPPGCRRSVLEGGMSAPCRS